MTFSIRPKRKSASSGIVWPDTGNDTPSGVKDVFGGRPFSAHISTVGYDYDFHRGVDVNLAEGDPYLSPVSGTVIRLHRNHFTFNTASQTAYWTEDNDGYGAAWTQGTGLTISGTRGGSNSWPNVSKYENRASPLDLTAGQWEMRMLLDSGVSAITGAVGFGVYDNRGTQRVLMEWDGTSLYAYGTYSGGNLSNNGSSTAWTSSKLWLRVRSSGTTLQWASSADGSTWTNAFTETNPSFTNGQVPCWVPTIYYRSKDTNATPHSVKIKYVGWYDTNTVGRFGNWLSIGRGTDKFTALHFDTLTVQLGDYVEAGQSLGTVGLTGFDDRSGPVTTPHVHVEYAPVGTSLYDNAESVNPLDSDIMPRTNVSNNVSVVRSTANDPDGVDSHKLVITCTRQAQDFDMNEFSLTGNTSSRTVNWNTRSGLNADPDIPKQSGVYFVASSFDENSASYVITIYFNKSTVGSTFTSAYIKDCNGVTLWSE